MMYSGSSGMDIMFSTMISNIIINKYNFNSMYSAPIMAVIMYLINMVKDDIETYVCKENLIIVGLIFLIYYYGKNFSFGIFKRKRTKNKVITITDDMELKQIDRYFYRNKEELFKDTDYSLGDCDSAIRCRISKSYYFTPTLITPFDEKIKFKDDELGFNGYITYKKKIHEQKKNSNNGLETDYIPLIFLDIEVGLDSITFTDYYNKISEINLKKDNIRDTIYYSKVVFNDIKRTNIYGREISYNHSTIIMHENKYSSLDERKEKYIDTFFHQNKRYLWNYIKKVDQEPDFFCELGQSPHCNFLFHGPPGSGKSTFITRVAKVLKRHVISIDFRNIQDRLDLYKFLSNIDISLSSNSLKDFIIVFEEFDITLDILEQKEEAKNKSDNFFLNYLKIQATKDIAIDDFEDEDEDKDKKDKKKKKKVKMSSDFTNRDLLEILQGSFPLNGAIIIATSNNYDNMKDKYPALFRDGRLTPIYFGYLNRSSFNEMCEFYFDKKIKDDNIPDELPIPTSSLVETIKDVFIQNVNKEEAFISFETSFYSLLNKYSNHN